MKRGWMAFDKSLVPWKRADRLDSLEHRLQELRRFLESEDHFHSQMLRHDSVFAGEMIAIKNDLRLIKERLS